MIFILNESSSKVLEPDGLENDLRLNLDFLGVKRREKKVKKLAKIQF